MQFCTRAVDHALQPYLPIFCALLPQIGAAGHDYLAMSRRISAATGGIRLSTNFLEQPDRLDSLNPVVELKGKVLERNHSTLCEILSDMLTAPDFTDLDRLRTVIGQVRVSMENSIPGAGHSFAARSAAASLTPTASQREEWSGMTQAKIIREMTDLDDQGLAKLSRSFTAITEQLFNQENLSVAVTAEDSALKKMQATLVELLEALPQKTSAVSPGIEFESRGTATGWHYNLPVAYVAQVFRTVPYTHPDAPVLMVLAKLLRSDFLHREIREKGGAYGGMAAYNAEGGLFSMLSYRDPHLERTLNVYQDGIDWVSRELFSEETIRESILTTFADLDRPLSPGGRGYREFLHQQQGLTHEMVQNFRNRVLETNQQQLNRVAQTYLQQGQTKSSVGVLAGEDMFNQAAAKLSQINMQMKKLEN